MTNQVGMTNRNEAPEPGRRLRRFYLVLGAVAAMGIAAVAYAVAPQVVSEATVEPVELGEIDDSVLVRLAEPVIRGDPEAPVNIIEFADFQCPACQNFATTTGPLVKRDLIDSGEVKLVFYDFPLVEIHPNAFIGARAARCAGDQDAYWAYHDALFDGERHRSWTAESSPAETLVGYAGELGLDRGAFEACLRSDRHAEVVTANRELAIRLNVNATPTIFVGREGEGRALRISNRDIGSLRDAVKAVAGGG